jgi:hypothetical protein
MLTGEKAASLALLVTLVVAGCTPEDDAEVATLAEAGVPVGDYVNEATAGYAGCLEEAGMTVAAFADDRAPSWLGYAEIEGAAFLPDASGGVSDDPDQPIGVDGVDRDNEVRGCYADHPGAKDAVIDSLDDPGESTEVGDEGIAPEEVEATLSWVQCARDAGVTVIDDPQPDGYVIIPQELELAEARMLGQECSVPMIEDEHWPLFLFHAGVEDATSGVMVVDPYIEAIDGPFKEALCKNHPDECSE